MARKAVERAKERLRARPLFYTAGRSDTTVEHLRARLAQIEGRENVPCLCSDCGGSGKKVPLYAIFNYGREFDHCYGCGFSYASY